MAVFTKPRDDFHVALRAEKTTHVGPLDSILVQISDSPMRLLDHGRALP